uniref:Uncharacterized protein n=1 Tax=Timema cristinae TaxID=61476 RepID=A0A7R9DI06_TIMCR|nr:unnamed protein product [Timema cristinae]
MLKAACPAPEPTNCHSVNARHRVLLPASDAVNIMDGHTSRVFCARFHPRNNYEFVSGGWDNTIQFWDIRQQFSVRNLGGVHICGNGIDISQSGAELLTCSWQPEDPIKLWDYGSGKLISVVKPDIFLSKLYCGLFIAKDFFMCGGTDTNLFRLVDTRNMSSLGILRGLDKGVYSMDVGPLLRRARQSFHIPHLPRVAFCAGRKIYELDFH